MEVENKSAERSGITRRKSTQYVKFCAKDERNASLKKVATILQKAEHDRSIEEQQVLLEYSEIVTDLKQRWHRRDEAKRRLEEVEEPVEVITEKCKILATALMQSEHLVVYTGAGISTAARIPDYRGTNGIWTRLQQGKDIGNHDLSLAEPTFTHMALSTLYHRKLLKYVVSQNCDGLHLRSGLPRCALSELHGNMYVEVCKHCKPVREYWRLFDVTENTARYAHKTMRRCYVCSKELTDTIVHFGERGTLQWPLNWSGACKNADKADTILCLGSSLKVLKKYPWLWQMNKPAKKRPNLYIVNLQWTPKDDCAVMKINGKCDDVMRQVMKLLGVQISAYDRRKDPIFVHATLLTDSEFHTTTQPFLKTIDESETDKMSIKSEGEEEIEEIKEEIQDSNLIEAKDEKLKLEPVADDETVKLELKIEETEEYEIEEEEEQLEAYDLSVSATRDKKFVIQPDCDNDVNINSSSKTNIITNIGSCSSNSLFSIDSILNNSASDSELIRVSNNDNNQLQSAIMAYYLANLQNPMFNYLIPGLYPYQTSLFYSGLHSIINPLPYFNYDFNCSSSNTKFTGNNINAQNVLIKHHHQHQKQEEQQQQPREPKCNFCYKTYESFICLFYQKYEPVFREALYRFSKKDNCNKELVCVCCDYTTEEESDSETENKNGTKAKKVKADESVENLENPLEINDFSSNSVNEDQIKKQDKIVKIQAGWFGKGCRKNRKIKKKQYSNR